MPQADQENQLTGKTSSTDIEKKENISFTKIQGIFLPKVGGIQNYIGEKFTVIPKTGTEIIMLPAIFPEHSESESQLNYPGSTTLSMKIFQFECLMSIFQILIYRKKYV
jgi:hypothetical protein